MRYGEGSKVGGRESVLFTRKGDMESEVSREVSREVKAKGAIDFKKPLESLYVTKHKRDESAEVVSRKNDAISNLHGCITV